MSKRFNKVDANKEIEMDLNETLTTLRKNYRSMVALHKQLEEEMHLAKAKGEEALAENELNARRCQELEGKYESVLVMKEKLLSDLKTQKDAFMREIEILKSSEMNLKKSIESIQGNYNQILLDMFELKVVACHPVQLRRGLQQARVLQEGNPSPQ